MSNFPQANEALAPEPKPAKRGCLRGLLLLAIALLVLAHFLTPVVARVVLNRFLPSALGTDASVQRIWVNLLLGRVGFQGLAIAQPEGFGEGPLLELGRVSLSVSTGSGVTRDPVTVRHVRVQDVTLHLLQDTNGVLNVSRLGPPPPPEPAPPSEEPPVTSDSAPAEIPPLRLRQLLVDNLDLLFEDLAKEWQLEIRDLRLEVTDLRVGGDSSDPGAFEGSLLLLSPQSRMPARLRLRGRVGTIRPDLPGCAPRLRLALGLIGFDLAALDPFLAPAPAAAKAALGGSGLDFTLFFDLAEGRSLGDQTISGHYALTTDGGRSYTGELSGTPVKPGLPFVDIFSNLFGTQLARITDLGGNVAQGAFEAAGGALETGSTAVKGAANLVKGVGGGLFRTAKGVATLDSREALGGLKESTLGTVEGALDTVKDTAVAAGHTVARTVDTVRGKDDVERWWAGGDARLEAFELAAKAWLDGF